MQVLSESLLWMGKAIEDFGLSIMNVQQLIGWIKVLCLTLSAIHSSAMSGPKAVEVFGSLAVMTTLVN